MATVVRSNLRLIVTAIRNQLILKTGLPEERVAVVFHRPLDAKADQDLQVVVGDAVAINPWTDFQGRESTRITRNVSIIINTRLALDPTDEATIWFMDGSYGHLQMEDKVLNALQIFLPFDNNQNVIVTEPLHYVGTDQVRKPISNSQGDEVNSLGWGQSGLHFTVSYEADVVQNNIEIA